jgi:hypothetical protein
MAKKSTQPKEGQFIYGTRAFEQDAMNAMKADIIRGLIEVITNSDDAYAQSDAGSSGKISIEVEHRRNKSWKVSGKDRAIGMSIDGMKAKLGSLGARTSGHAEGKDVRGNLGRGARDLAAFGPVVFESIHNGRFASLQIASEGWKELADRRASGEDRERLGIIRGNGLKVTITVDKNISCRTHKTLRTSLNTHYQLRDILSDSSRRIELTDLTARPPVTDRLSYEYPKLKPEFKGSLSIAGYKKAKATLTISRLAERSDRGKSDQGRVNGILIKGRRAIYENTLCKFESDVYSAWFTGEVRCPFIDDLAKEYDDRKEQGLEVSPENGMPIITRTRDGLSPEHPFVQALKTAIEKPLGDLIAKESERDKGEGAASSEEARKRLIKAEQEAARIFDEEMRELEAEDLPDDGGMPPEIAIYPPESYAYIGESRTLTVAVRKNGFAEGDDVEVSLDPIGVAECEKPVVQLKTTNRRPDILVAQIRLKPMLADEPTIVTASISDESATALVNVRAEREVIEEELEPPETFQFARPVYRIGWQKSKDLKLVAPVELVAEHGSKVRVRSDNSGVVIKGSSTVNLSLDDEGEYYFGSVPVEARNLGVTASLTATLGSIDAETRILVTRKEEGSKFKIRMVAGREYGFWPYQIETEDQDSGGTVTVIKIAKEHKSLQVYLGTRNEGENSPVCRQIIANILSDAIAREVVKKLYQKRHNLELFDADRFYREHYKRATKSLPRFQRVLVGSAEGARANIELEPTALVE